MKPPAKFKKIAIYEDDAGRAPFDSWFKRLNREAKTRVLARLAKLRTGNLGQWKGLKGGIIELKIDHGPGYRVYAGQVGDELIILLGGGDKKSQQADIETAIKRWQHHLARPA